MQEVSHALLLGVQVSLIVFVGGNLDRYVLYNLKAICLKTDTFHGIVGQ